MEWIISAVVVLMAALLKGMTGFGFALLAVPLLSLIFPIQSLIPAMTIFNLITSVYILTKIKLKIKAKYFLPMLLASLIGIPIGVYVLTYFPEKMLELAAGISIFSISMVFLLGGNHLAPEKRREKPIVFAGFLSGLLTSSMSIGGPPIALAMNRKGYSKESFRKIFALISVINAAISSILYVVKGIFVAFSVKFAIVLLPVIIVGSKIGNVMATRIDQLLFRKVILYLNMSLGLFIIIRTIVGH
ncbi:sulfite exporter TauE/SafE family protein [Sunxiuqinia sp. A32]|uniref:sulfite exporter TauE/SafE family protein n=1 Tax=Sunxiuqinia sp. A32 TaxID=3461496 RepID=UPI0040463124